MNPLFTGLGSSATMTYHLNSSPDWSDMSSSTNGSSGMPGSLGTWQQNPQQTTSQNAIEKLTPQELQHNPFFRDVLAAQHRLEGEINGLRYIHIVFS